MKKNVYIPTRVVGPAYPPDSMVGHCVHNEQTSMRNRSHPLLFANHTYTDNTCGPASMGRLGLDIANKQHIRVSSRKNTIPAPQF